MTNRIPTESEYQRAELARFHKEMSGGSLDTSEFLDYCRNYTDTILERIDWLLAGHYGQGALLAYKALGPRHNRRAWLFCTIARLEWGVSNRAARKTWSLLSPDKQAEINTKIDRLIQEHEKPE